MNNLAAQVICALLGKTLVTAESCTGGMIGAALTSVPGSSVVYKGGVISYCDDVKENVLGVNEEVLQRYGAVSCPVAGMMAGGVRKLLKADIAVSVTGVAGPDTDAFENPVGTVYIGYEDQSKSFVNVYHFDGDRQSVRLQATMTAMQLLLDNC